MRTIILLHGLLCDATVWTHLVPTLQSQFNAITPDIGEHDSIGAMAEAALAGAPLRFALAGFSMGGRVALDIHRRYPERVEQLILIDTSAPPATSEESRARQSLVDLAFHKGMEAVATRWLPPMIHPSRHNDMALMLPLRDMVMRQTPERLRRQQTALLNRPDMRPHLAAIECPTLILCGAQDTLFPVTGQRQFADAIPDAALEVVADCGHFTTVERPEVTNDLIRTWLATTYRAGPAASL